MSATAPLTATQVRRLNKYLRLPGDVRLGDMVSQLAAETAIAQLPGQASNTSNLNHIVFWAPTGLTVASIKVIPAVNDVGGATTASHTFTFKKNNAGTIASLVSVATINKGVIADAGAIDAVQGVLVAGDQITADVITGSTAAASQAIAVIINYGVNFTGQGIQ